MTTHTTHIEAGNADAIDAWDDDIAADAASPDPHIAMRRFANDLMRLWALCGKPACRRSQHRRYGTLAPEAARHGMLLTLMAIQDGIHPDELLADEIPEIATLDAWVARVEATLRGRSRSPDSGP